jgi:hypothetical protein
MTDPAANGTATPLDVDGYDANGSPIPAPAGTVIFDEASSVPQQLWDQTPPVANAFVAPGCERFSGGLTNELHSGGKPPQEGAVVDAELTDVERERLQAHVRMEREAALHRESGTVVGAGSTEPEKNQQAARQYCVPPTVGRTVHYMPPHIAGNAQSVLTAAIITKVWSPEYVNLRVFHDDERNPEHVTSVPIRTEGDEALGRFWQWPERM